MNSRHTLHLSLMLEWKECSIDSLSPAWWRWSQAAGNNVHWSDLWPIISEPGPAAACCCPPSRQLKFCDVIGWAESRATPPPPPATLPGIVSGWWRGAGLNQKSSSAVLFSNCCPQQRQGSPPLRCHATRASNEGYPKVRSWRMHKHGEGY